MFDLFRLVQLLLHQSYRCVLNLSVNLLHQNVLRRCGFQLRLNALRRCGARQYDSTLSQQHQSGSHRCVQRLSDLLCYRCGPHRCGPLWYRNVQRQSGPPARIYAQDQECSCSRCFVWRIEPDANTLASDLVNETHDVDNAARCAERCYDSRVL